MILLLKSIALLAGLALACWLGWIIWHLAIWLWKQAHGGDLE